MCVYTELYTGKPPKISNNPGILDIAQNQTSDLDLDNNISQLLANLSATVKREKLRPQRAMVSWCLPSGTTSEIFRPGIASWSR